VASEGRGRRFESSPSDQIVSLSILSRAARHSALGRLERPRELLRTLAQILPARLVSTTEARPSLDHVGEARRPHSARPGAVAPDHASTGYPEQPITPRDLAECG
jgi:hypothetical protein